jgi:hypothetical protein
MVPVMMVVCGACWAGGGPQVAELNREGNMHAFVKAFSDLRVGACAVARFLLRRRRSEFRPVAPYVSKVISDLERG